MSAAKCPVRPIATVYIDAFNLYRRALQGTPCRWLEAGRPPMAGLILDQREGEVEYFPVANGILTLGSVTRCLEDLLGEAPGRLDAAWLIDSWGNVSRVR